MHTRVYIYSISLNNEHNRNQSTALWYTNSNIRKRMLCKKLMQLFIKVFNPIQQFPGHAMLTV